MIEWKDAFNEYHQEQRRKTEEASRINLEAQGKTASCLGPNSRKVLSIIYDVLRH